MDKETQHSRIIKMLKRAPKHGVENYKFPQAGILCYTKRIQELREDGYNISAVRQIINNRYTGVWKYFLVEDEYEDMPKESFWSSMRKAKI